jgi:hypothetical protein
MELTRVRCPTTISRSNLLKSQRIIVRRTKSVRWLFVIPEHPVRLVDQVRRRATEAPADAAPAAAREGDVFVSVGIAIHHSRLCPNDRACRGRPRPEAEGAPAHAAPRLRLRAGQQGAATPGRSRASLAIGRSPARPSTRRWRRTGSRTSGGSEPPPTAHCGAYKATFQEASRHSPAFSRKKACRA